MLPFIVLAVLGVVLLYAGLTNNKQILVPIAVGGLLITLGLLLRSWDHEQSYYNQMVLVDNFSIAFNAIAIVTTIFIMLLSVYYFEGVREHVAENFSLMIFTLFGVFLMTSFSNIVMLFIGIETLSIPLYVLAGAKKFSLRSNEASFKYFLMGAFSSAILLMGIALVYGSTSSFDMQVIANQMVSVFGFKPGIFYIGLVLILMGFSFKVAIIPFHFWTPDVYEGSPTIITLFMATVVKTAGFAAFYRFFRIMIPTGHIWQDIAWGLAAVTLIGSNLAALNQQGMKRLLAYSSISHSGFMLIAVLVMSKLSTGSLLFYAFAYSIASVTIFGILIRVKNYKQSIGTIAAFNGLARNNPLLALALTVSLWSLAGIPLTAGFFAKYYVF
ncbi:MAG: NADH-quinone oxidoreductase subunit N, partial [Bacteroidota bacterium]|nr:NADH-quinone oxidoreductase subunit N [Bacteroidota bacterium]